MGYFLTEGWQSGGRRGGRRVVKEAVGRVVGGAALKFVSKKGTKNREVVSWKCELEHRYTHPRNIGGGYTSVFCVCAARHSRLNLGYKLCFRYLRIGCFSFVLFQVPPACVER